MQTLRRGQMAEGVSPQVQTVAVTHRQFDSVVPVVVRRRFVPVAVQGENVVACQFGNVGQPVGQLRGGVRQNPVVDLVQHGQPPRAVQRGEVIG